MYLPVAFCDMITNYSHLPLLLVVVGLPPHATRLTVSVMFFPFLPT